MNIVFRLMCVFIATELVDTRSPIWLQLAMCIGMAIQAGVAYLVRDDIMYTVTAMSPVLLIAIVAM